MASAATNDGLTSTLLTLICNAGSYVFFEPFVTGSLLFLLAKAPSDAQRTISQTLFNVGLNDDHLRTLVKLVRWSLGLGILRKVNQGLTWLAFNNWQFRRPGGWHFGDEKLTEVIVITGGCSGFGRLMVEGFAGKGKIVILDIADLPEDLKDLKEVHYYKCDVTDAEAIKSVASRIREDHGHPNVLINNAGIAIGTTILDAPDDYVEKIFQVNVISHFILIKQFLPAMLEARKGHIVTMASIASYTSLPPILHYCCTKTAANYLNDGLRSELLTRYPNGDTILTTSVHPTFHDTPMISTITGGKTLMTSDPVYPARNVADIVVKHVLEGKSGKLFIPEGQYYISFLKFLPTWFFDVLLFARVRKSKKKTQQ